SSKLGINGEPALYEQLVALADKNRSWNQIGLTYRTSDLRLGVLATAESELEIILYDESKANYYPYLPSDDELMPKLTYDEAEAAELSMYETAIKSYLQEMTAKFITGESDIETGWDSYLSELEEIGLDNMLAIYQAAYDDKYGQ
ncbi:MAG TPA: ABC transporter substrate-binding protein, partial [Clostridiales bacterium]|nr:ABC transporter substrate-binding protein [Clostridiales bacterium]